MTNSTARVRTENEAEILADVRHRFETTENPRLRQLMLGLIDHLHAFVANEVTWAEWEASMAFLARGAAVTKDGRNEFIALSDSIGVSMQVLAASQPKPPGATIPTLIGPFFLNEARFSDWRRYRQRGFGAVALCSWSCAGHVWRAGKRRDRQRLAVRRSRPL